MKFYGSPAMPLPSASPVASSMLQWQRGVRAEDPTSASSLPTAARGTASYADAALT